MRVDKIAIIKSLDADEIKLQIGKRIERIGQSAQIELREPRVEPSQSDAVRNVVQQSPPMRFLQCLRAVRHRPWQRLFVNIT